MTLEDRIDELVKRIRAIEKWQLDYESRNWVIDKKDVERIKSLENQVTDLEDWQVAWYLGKHQGTHADKALKRIQALEHKVFHTEGDCCKCG